jgi:hypothetical protein
MSVFVSGTQEGNTQPQFWAEADKTLSWLDKEYQPFLPKIKADPQLLLADASESTYAYYASASGWHMGWYAEHVPWRMLVVFVPRCVCGCCW